MCIRLGPQLRGTPMAAAGSDIRLYRRPAASPTYPDDDEYTLTEARNSAAIAVPSFEEYLLLEQDAIRAEHYVRQPDGCRLLRELSGAEAEIALESIGCRLNLGELYSRAKLR